jgi:hypothetical protein
MYAILYFEQKSLYQRLTTDKKSEVFFKVLYDYIREALQEIKATVSVNTAESLASKNNEDGKDCLSIEGKKKSEYGCRVVRTIFCKRSCIIN